MEDSLLARLAPDLRYLRDRVDMDTLHTGHTLALKIECAQIGETGSSWL